MEQWDVARLSEAVGPHVHTLQMEDYLLNE